VQLADERELVAELRRVQTAEAVKEMAYQLEPRWQDNRGMSCVDGSRIARINLMVWRGGRVQSCVRPVAAVHMTAGPDGMHG
jgi:hypothetical protein